MSHPVLQVVPLFPHNRGNHCWNQEQHKRLSKVKDQCHSSIGFNIEGIDELFFSLQFSIIFTVDLLLERKNIF